MLEGAEPEVERDVGERYRGVAQAPLRFFDPEAAELELEGGSRRLEAALERARRDGERLRRPRERRFGELAAEPAPQRLEQRIAAGELAPERVQQAADALRVLRPEEPIQRRRGLVEHRDGVGRLEHGEEARHDGALEPGGADEREPGDLLAEPAVVDAHVAGERGERLAVD